MSLLFYTRVLALRVDQRHAVADGHTFNQADEDRVIAAVVCVGKTTLDAGERVAKDGNSGDVILRLDIAEFVRGRFGKLLGQRTLLFAKNVDDEGSRFRD